MADTTVTNETAATTPTGAELARIVQGGSSKKTTLAVIGHQFRGARARLTADEASANYTTETAIPFDQADFDTDSFWSAGTPDRLTIPAGKGITHVEVTGQAQSSASTAGSPMSVSVFQYNSSDTILRVVGHRFIERDGVGMTLSASTGPLGVSDGDYFRLMYREGSDTSVVIEGDNITETFLSLKVIGMEPV